MLQFEMIENNMDFVSYRYFPENDTLFGTISVRKADKTIIAQTIAENDEFKCFFPIYTSASRNSLIKTALKSKAQSFGIEHPFQEVVLR
ncbi:MAG: hypothetical protein IJB69_09080 [Clostridia bacterium]|nr:hypothetical protein [Clostridia bacterium]